MPDNPYGYEFEKLATAREIDITLPPAIDTTRALIAEAENYAGLDQYPGAMLIRDLAAALSVFTRPDTDLDAIEKRVTAEAWTAEEVARHAMSALDTIDRSRRDIFALIALVRTAEALIALVRDDMHLEQMTPNPNDPGAYVLGAEAERAMLAWPASRTVETAEEPRALGVGAKVKHARLGYTGKITAFDPPWGWRVHWEDKPGEAISTEPEDGSTIAVPPTPETEEDENE